MPTSLPLAEKLTNIVNIAREDGSFLARVTPATSELLTYWFDEAYCDTRPWLNFHEGQRQAILNTIYCHEILGVRNVTDLYDKVDSTLKLESDVGIDYLDNKRFSFPRYCMKMATGTGKTWVLNALLIWQYLNANSEHQNLDGASFSKNFMIVAPWLIVYDRLLDAVMGKTDDEGKRNFATSDFSIFQELFIPEHHRADVFAFVQSSIVTKEDIGRKVINNGQIIITNRHILLDKTVEELEEEHLDDPYQHADKIINDLIPLRPWTSAGNSLETLDNKALGGGQKEYLKSIPDLVVFNDEAHHLGEWTSKSDVDEDKKRQQAVNEIAQDKKFFVQIDFSATPYIQKWSEKKHFPHIIVDFPLIDAIKKWYVKTLVLDKRKEVASLATQDLDFKAERDENGKPIALSIGQKVMVKAWLEKLKVLERDFGIVSVEHNKYPKMMIVCEDTLVVPLVAEYLQEMWYSEDQYLEVHSNKKWEIGEQEWKILKQKLFSIDKYENPKVIISVLMLREGFDVNNICVIVPLRSSQSSILLEQTIGRWLRLMWRWEGFEEMKVENRMNMLVKKIAPKNYFDILSIVEHPAFEAFYDELMADGGVGVDESDIGEGNVLWDMEVVSLKENYKEYDIVWPIIVNDVEEVMSNPIYSLDKLHGYHHSFEELRKIVPQNEKFISQTIASGTRFGDYDVNIGIMNAKSYNDYVSKLVTRITKHTTHADGLNKKWFGSTFPALQIHLPQLAWLVDGYLRYKLFKENIDYGQENNWKVLMLPDIVQFVIKEVTRVIIEAQDTERIGEPEIIEKPLSLVTQLNMRQDYSIEVAKSVYPKLSYPSNKGELEKAFMQYVDSDSSVESFCKIYEQKHDYFRCRYIRHDWIPAYYYADFIVKTHEKIYLVETKGTSSIADENVKRKKISATNYIERINNLPEKLRSHRIREYVLLSEDRFYTYKNNNATIQEMLESAKLQGDVKKTLF